MKYESMIKEIVELVGGEDNIASAYHCVTRLRFKLKDSSKADMDALAKVQGAMGALEAAGQTQVIIGQHVGDVYNELQELYHFNSGELKGAAEMKDEMRDKKVSSNILDLIAGLFTPVLPLMTATGVIKGLLSLFVSLGWLDSASGAYTFLYAMGDSFFYFIPIFLGYTAMKKFRGTPGLGAVIGAALVYPTLSGITSGDVLYTLFEGTAFAMPVYTTFFGIPVIFNGYASSVVPVIFICALAAPIERFLNEHLHAYIKSFVAPSVTLLIAATLGFLIVGPVVSLLSNALGAFMSWIFGIAPMLAGALYGLLIQVCVVFGIHWGFVAICLNNFATLGYDPVTICGMACCFAFGGVVLAIFIRTKNEQLKGVCMPAFFSAMFGITEPAIYGVTLQRKKAFALACVSGGIGGAILGAAGVKQYVMAANGIFGWIQVIPPTGFDMTVWASIIACVVSFVFSLIMTFVLWEKLDIE